jgi:hypothetical protein
MGYAETHHALVLIWLLFASIADSLSATQLTLTPTGLTTFVSK